MQHYGSQATIHNPKTHPTSGQISVNNATTTHNLPASLASSINSPKHKITEIKNCNITDAEGQTYLMYGCRMPLNIWDQPCLKQIKKSRTAKIDCANFETIKMNLINQYVQASFLEWGTPNSWSTRCWGHQDQKLILMFHIKVNHVPIT